MKCMESDELLASEFRSDFLYHDPKKKHPTGEHIAAQFRFYKAGIHRHTVSVSMFVYSDENQRYHLLTQLSEGNLPHQFFSDADCPPLPFMGILAAF